MNKKSYQTLNEELQSILRSFDDVSELDIDKLLIEYERGMSIIKELQARLREAELRIQTVQKDA